MHIGLKLQCGMHSHRGRWERGGKSFADIGHGETFVTTIDMVMVDKHGRVQNWTAICSNDYQVNRVTVFRRGR